MKLKKGNGGKNSNTYADSAAKRFVSSLEAPRKKKLSELAKARQEGVERATERKRDEREDEKNFRRNVAKYPPKMIAETSVEDLAKMGVEKLRKLMSENEYHQYSAMGVEGPKRETVGGLTLKQLKENEKKINRAGQMAYDQLSQSEKSRLRRKGEGYNPAQYKKIKNLGESVIRF